MEFKLRIVDQTRSQCPNGKVSCSVSITSANSNSYDISNVEVRVAEVPEDYSPRDADMYFDNSDVSAGYTFGQGNQCATYDQASEGMTNVIIVCADFTLTSGTERICSMSKNMRPKVRFMTVTRTNRGRRGQAATTTRARGSSGPFVGRLLQESSEEEENANDLVVTFPQAFVWENTTGEDEVFPMILSSNTTWEVDACLLLPPGHVLVAILDADSDEPIPIEGVCSHVVVAGEDLVLLFSIAQEDPWSRTLKKRIGMKSMIEKKKDKPKEGNDVIVGKITAEQKKKYFKGKKVAMNIETPTRNKRSKGKPKRPKNGK